MNKLLIVEDDIGISNSLKLYFENSNFEIDLYHTGKGAIKKVLEGDYNMIILDVNLPGVDGIKICEGIRDKSSIPILMLTARTSELDRITGLEIGADDYIAKPFSPRELLARINGILRRSKTSGIDTGEQITIGGVTIDKQKRLVSVNDEEVPMTKNEYDILVKIFEENGKVVSREVLMTEVIGYDHYLYDRTLDTHIKNLRKKINNKGLILTIRGEGYRLNT